MIIRNACVNEGPGFRGRGAQRRHARCVPRGQRRGRALRAAPGDRRRGESRAAIPSPQPLPVRSTPTSCRSLRRVVARSVAPTRDPTVRLAECGSRRVDILTDVGDALPSPLATALRPGGSRLLLRRGRGGGQFARARGCRAPARRSDRLVLCENGGLHAATPRRRRSAEIAEMARLARCACTACLCTGRAPQTTLVAAAAVITLLAEYRPHRGCTAGSSAWTARLAPGDHRSRSRPHALRAGAILPLQAPRTCTLARTPRSRRTSSTAVDEANVTPASWTSKSTSARAGEVPMSRRPPSGCAGSTSRPRRRTPIGTTRLRSAAGNAVVDALQRAARPFRVPAVAAVTVGSPTTDGRDSAPSPTGRAGEPDARPGRLRQPLPRQRRGTMSSRSSPAPLLAHRGLLVSRSTLRWAPSATSNARTSALRGDDPRPVAVRQWLAAPGGRRTSARGRLLGAAWRDPGRARRRPVHQLISMPRCRAKGGSVNPIGIGWPVQRFCTRH